MRRLLGILVGILLVFLVVIAAALYSGARVTLPSARATTQAQTVPITSTITLEDVMQMIASLQAQVTNLQAEIAAMRSEPIPSPSVQETVVPAGPIDDLGIFWGPAGVAPQNIPSAIVALQLDQGTASYLTVLYPAPGDDRVIGWVIGTTVSESQGIQMNVGRLPAGVCVDYDPGATDINGMTVGEPLVLTPKWSRVLMASDGSASGLKMTIYWTPCDGIQQNAAPMQIGEAVVIASVQEPTATVEPTVVVPAATVMPEPTEAAANACPTIEQLAQDVIVTMPKTQAERDALMESFSILPRTNSEGILYEGASVAIRAPDRGRIDYDGGEVGAGSPDTVTTPIFTYWCNG